MFIESKYHLSFLYNKQKVINAAIHPILQNSFLIFHDYLLYLPSSFPSLPLFQRLFFFFFLIISNFLFQQLHLNTPQKASQDALISPP